MRIFDNYGRSNGKTMELACQIAEAISGKGTVVVIPIKELIEYKNNSIREFAEWLINSKYHGICNDGFMHGVSDLHFKFKISSIDELLAEYEKEQKKVKSDGDNCTVGND